MDQISPIKTVLPDGTVIRIEARSSGGSFPAPVSDDPEVDVGIRDVFSFEGISSAIESVADAMTKTFAKVKPDKATVEFGIDVSVESGGLTALIVKGTGGATLTVTLEWGGK